MYQFEVQGITTTDLSVQLHGVWLMGATKRFDVIKLPIELFLNAGILEHLSRTALARARHMDEEWEQFLLWG